MDVIVRADVAPDCFLKAAVLARGRRSFAGVPTFLAQTEKSPWNGVRLGVPANRSFTLVA